MVTITRLNHIVLYVRDARKSLDFYQGVLDFQPTAPPTDRGVFLRVVAGAVPEEAVRRLTCRPDPLVRPTRASAG